MNLGITTTGLAAAALVVGIAGTAPAAADPSFDRDPDTNFAHQLHTVGIYGQKDYNAWIGKIMCKRIYTNVDPDVFASANFVRRAKLRGRSARNPGRWSVLGECGPPRPAPRSFGRIHKALGPPGPGAFSWGKPRRGLPARRAAIAFSRARVGRGPARPG